MPYRILRDAIITNGIVQIMSMLAVYILDNILQKDFLDEAFVYLVMATIGIAFLLTFLSLTFPLVDKTADRLPFYYLLFAIIEIVLPIAVFFYAIGGNMC